MSNENNVNSDQPEQILNTGEEPIDKLIGKLMSDYVVITYQLTTAIASKLFIQEPSKLKSVKDFINEVNKEPEGDTNDDETTEMPDVR